MTPGGWLLVGLGDGGSAERPARERAGTRRRFSARCSASTRRGSDALRTKILSHRDAQPVAVRARPHDERSLHRRRRAEPLGRGRRHPARSAPGEGLRLERDGGGSLLQGGDLRRARSSSPPVVEYGHDAGLLDHRRRRLPRDGRCRRSRERYFYSDYCTAFLRSFRWTRAGGATDHWDWTQRLEPQAALAQIASFGEDEDGEVYIIGLTGTIWKLVPA